ncbi:MAG TPA: hypothetical protein VJS38_17725 [Phenylobacterium sp.]|uniref:hypothetical protein n=1 Tax=Phenylobacterium sp. TaxID=1871053 RepID=UPI002B4643B3|nr:hypothetical protein [Phenylobacterium sp.]HKR90010.1 hypothetical protein [Phenylobacterium sp.]
MRICMRAALRGAAFAGLAGLASPALAHGIAGDRFFPATIATDDPFNADELSLPTVSRLKTGDEPSARETDISGEWSKRLTSKLGVSFSGDWTRIETPGLRAATGFQNLETTLKYQAVTNAEHEAIVSVGVSGEWGGTGSGKVGAEAIGTVTPTVYFGKGFGDLPASLNWLRPAAVTGTLGYAIPVQGHELAEDPACAGCAPIRQATIRSLEWGVAFEYSLRYLQSQVKDLGLPAFVNQLTPLVEISASTPVANGFGETTTGTVNPGVLWSGKRMQFGLEAQIPMNRQSGSSVGVLFQVHWFLDDLFPHSLGKPIW